MAVNSLVPTESAWVDRLFTQSAFSPEYQDLKFILHRKLLDRINLEMLSSVAVDRVRTEVRSAVARLVEEEKTPLSMMEKDRIIGEVLDEVFGLGPLEPLLADPTISDILVTTPKLVYIERAGKLYKTPVQFKDNQHLMRIIEKIVARVGRRVDESSPLVDARLPDGSRVNAAIPPVAVDGPLLSIRRFGRDPLKAEDLVRILTMTDGMMELCKACVKARLNILISGGTGAGKTTLLNVLSSFISEDERIVTIEDAAELKLRQEHVARMETRPPNIEGTGAIRIRELVINALRMRPDRIIVGEVRGEEALDMLQAMNTGHDGSLTTIHANSPRDAFGRLEVMVGMANANMGMRAIRQQVSSALDLVVQIARMSDGSRRVVALTECVGMEGDLITMQDIFVFERTGLTDKGRVTGRFRATGIRPRFYEQLRASGVQIPTSLFQTVVELGAAIMTPLIGFIVFLVLFAVLMMAVGLGTRLLEVRGKKQIATMLNPAAAQTEEAEASILVTQSERDPFDDFLERSNLQGGLQAKLAQAGLQWSPSQLLLSMVVLGIAGGVLGYLIQPLGFMVASVLAFAFVLGGAPYFYVSYKRNSRLHELEEQLPEALDFLARSMRAGHAFSISLEMIGTEMPDPLGQEFRALFAEHNLGAPIEVAMANFGKRVPLLDVRLFISSVALQRQTGGNLSEVLTRLAFLIRERFRLRGQVKAASAHGRLTSMVLTVLPIVMIFALNFVAPDYLPQMVKDPDGKYMIVAAVVFQILGYLVMRKIVNIKV